MISAEAPKSRKVKVVKVDSDEEVGCFGQVSSDNPQKQKPDQPQIILSFSSSLYLYNINLFNSIILCFFLEVFGFYDFAIQSEI